MTASSPFASTRRSGPAGPLSGVRVLDLSAYIAGPYGCTLLADQGADVIKVEPPGGDNLRQYPSTLQSENRAFLGVNRSKQGVVLDLKSPKAWKRCCAWRAVADVLVHNFRPGVPERLGIDYERLSRLNPRLIYCAVTGYGETGPLKDKAGYDQVLQAMSGMCVLQGKPDGAPEIVYGSMVDYYAAALVAAGVASALFERERSGQGQFVGVSLLRSALTMQSARMIWAEGEALDIWRDMRSGGITGLHPTREGYLYLSANTPHFWKALCEKTGLAELAERSALRHRAQARTACGGDRAEAARRVDAAHGAGVGAGVRRRGAVRDGAARSRTCSIIRKCSPKRWSPTIEHPTLGSYRGVARPIKFGRTPGPAPFAAPALGQDTQDVIAASRR